VTKARHAAHTPSINVYVHTLFIRHYGTYSQFNDHSCERLPMHHCTTAQVSARQRSSGSSLTRAGAATFFVLHSVSRIPAAVGY
jgi:hypothetical protein